MLERPRGGDELEQCDDLQPRRKIEGISFISLGGFDTA